MPFTSSLRLWDLISEWSGLRSLDFLSWCFMVFMRRIWSSVSPQWCKKTNVSFYIYSEDRHLLMYPTLAPLGHSRFNLCILLEMFSLLVFFFLTFNLILEEKLSQQLSMLLIQCLTKSSVLLHSSGGRGGLFQHRNNCKVSFYPWSHKNVHKSSSGFFHFFHQFK